MVRERRGRLVEDEEARRPRQGSGDLDDLALAVEGKDTERMSGIAHSLKGSSLTIGALKLGDLALELETMGRSSSCAGAELVLRKLRAEFERVQSDALRVIDPKEWNGAGGGSDASAGHSTS